MEGVQATLTIDDVVESELALKRNPTFRALVAERYGITDLSLLAVDPWHAAAAPASRLASRLAARLAAGLMDGSRRTTTATRC